MNGEVRVSEEAVIAAARVAYDTSREHGDRLRGFAIGQRYDVIDDGMRASVNEQMRAALAAAVPFIEAELREQIANEIEALREFWGRPGSAAISHAARIVRGQS